MLTIIKCDGDHVDLIHCSEEEHIRHCMQDLLHTPKGKRKRFPDYGTKLEEYLFKPIDPEWEVQVELEVQKAIQAFEKRIDNFAINVNTDNSGQIELLIDYRIKSSQSRSSCLVVISGESDAS
jgi:uncharacterized protein